MCKHAIITTKACDAKEMTAVGKNSTTLPRTVAGLLTLQICAGPPGSPWQPFCHPHGGLLSSGVRFLASILLAGQNGSATIYAGVVAFESASANKESPRSCLHLPPVLPPSGRITSHLSCPLPQPTGDRLRSLSLFDANCSHARLAGRAQGGAVWGSALVGLLARGMPETERHTKI
ncbi:hypothetical protein ZHAS_00013626 [Anopheles sinensis]|uniref:Uncharacterized protein n=1 Tax=Anopheles sinensis TaxID=74873 RepID=A0A084W5Y9_ANOSI|nr:hypothetical protein ZHAS_00013626 [Anopheles sinensis]